MKNKNIFLFIAIISIVIIITSYLSIKITKLFTSIKEDDDYQNIGLQIKDIDIEYCTQYDYGSFDKYKVYKIKNYYSDSMDKFKVQLENNNLWTRDKFYEYIMKEFYEIKENEEIKIDRENLYYYQKGNTYAIFDIKSAKLYYFENRIFNEHNDYSMVLGINIKNYIEREIYSVRGGWQDDGIDYYTYQFGKEEGKRIVKILEQSTRWSKERLDDDQLESFEYNEEVLSIENGYYHYELVCRASDVNKRINVTEESATGFEIGVYDAQENILYYFWLSI